MSYPLVTARLHLRPLNLADAPRIETLADDFEIARWLTSVPHPYPKGGARDFIKSIRPGQNVLAICLKDGALIGCLSLFEQPLKPNEAQLGYWLGKAFWHKGYMSEALSGFLHRVFAQDGLDKVTAGVFAENTASKRLQEKLGFKRTGEDMLYSLARGCEVPSLKTELARDEFLRLHK